MPLTGTGKWRSRTLCHGNPCNGWLSTLWTCLYPTKYSAFRNPWAYSKLRCLLFLNAGWTPSCSKRGPSFSPQSPLLSFCQGWHVGLFPRAQWEHSWVVRQVSSGHWSWPALLLLCLEKAPGRLSGCSVCQAHRSPSSGVWAEPSWLLL